MKYSSRDFLQITSACSAGGNILTRVSGIAGAVFASLLCLSSIVAGQQTSSKDQASREGSLRFSRREWPNANGKSALSGTVFDVNRAVIVQARISISNSATKEKIVTESNEQGQFRVSGLPPEIYEVVIESPGFRKLTIISVRLASNEILDMRLLLETPGPTDHDLTQPEPIDTPEKLVISETLIQRKLIQRIPK